MKMNINIFLKLRKLAIQNSIEYAKFSSAILIKNRVICFGCNSLKSHPMQARFGRNEAAIFWHAETNVIKSALDCVNPEDLAKADLYICRVKRIGPGGSYVFGQAHPCAGCMRAIREFQFKQIHYTTDDEGVVETLYKATIEDQIYYLK